MVCTLLHSVLVLANLDSSRKSLLNQVYQQCTYVQERHLFKLQKLRQLTVDDIWPLPERFRLHTAYNEFKYNTDESYFLVRAVVRMMWRSMIPVYIVGLLLQFVPLIKLRLNSNVMRNVEDFSNYSMSMIAADVLRIVIVQLLDSQQDIAGQFIDKEMTRVEKAIDLEIFRLPLARLGLRKPMNAGTAKYYVKRLTEFPDAVFSLLNAITSMLIAVYVLYNQLGR
ncbi:hypothetical protein IWW37_006120, partial [Coemansia sp. RSA 2050]